MKTITVGLGRRSYPVHIGDGVLRMPELLRPHLGAGKTLIVTDDVVAPLYLAGLREQLPDAHHVILPAGEDHKTPAGLNPVFDALVDAGCGRDATIVALGGGVIGDMAGFAAACFSRGIPFVQVPTTLLAQVDSSVGGKTGVNHPGGKNLIGAFHQPVCVLADTATLATLDQRNLRAGLAEVIKYGLIVDAAFLQWLEETMPALLARDSHALVEAIARCCTIKAEVVAADEREKGRRAILNLGHTFGHAIEVTAGFGQWLHGEAVAAGMAMAADMSARMGWLSGDDVARITRILTSAGLPVAPPAISKERFAEAMRHDKKVSAGRVRLVLMKAMGHAELVADYPDKILDDVLVNALS